MKGIYLILLISVLGPVIGSLIGVIRKPSERFIHKMLAFAAGIMLAVSFLELIPSSIEISSIMIAAIGIIFGAILMFLLDISIPHIHPELCQQEQGRTLKKTSVYLMVGIFLHNFPEGMALAIGSVTGFQTALIVALAIAIHNIPEGICTSAPYYYSTKKRMKSFLLSSATAIPILIGFLFASYLFKFLTNNFIGLILAGTAGLMIYISADELIPTACDKNHKQWSHSTIFALIAGVLLVILLGLIG